METTNENSFNKQLENPDYDGVEARLCSDGKYRWTYPMNMLTNPSIYITVCKIFGGIAALVFIVSYIGPIFRGEFSSILSDLKWWGIGILVFFAISMIAYLIVAAQYGWKYIISFTMDESGISHEQIPAQKKIAKRIGGVVGGAGVLTGDITRTAQGAMVASHTSLSSDFSKVKSVKPMRRWNTIKVNEPFAKNQVYTTKEDFDFVLNYILEHCPKVKQ